MGTLESLLKIKICMTRVKIQASRKAASQDLWTDWFTELTGLGDVLFLIIQGGESCLLTSGSQ